MDVMDVMGGLLISFVGVCPQQGGADAVDRTKHLYNNI